MNQFNHSVILLLFILSGQCIFGQNTVVIDSFIPRLMLPIGHTNMVDKVSYTPNGKQILSKSPDGTAKIWDAKTGKLLLDLNSHKKGIRDAQYSHDGRRIVTASYDETAKVWDAETGKELLSLTDHKGIVYCAQYSADGIHIVTASSDGTAKMWDANTGNLIQNFKGHAKAVFSAQFSPDGNQIVTASGDKSAKIWDVNTGNLLHDLQGHTDYVFSAQYSPDGEYIVTASGDKTAKAWGAKTGKELTNMIGHFYSITHFNFSPNSKYIITTSPDQTAKVWDIQNGEILFNLVHHKGLMDTIGFDPIYFEQRLPKETVNDGSFSPDGRYIVTASSRTIKIWDTLTGKIIIELVGHEAVVKSCRYSPDGKNIISGSTDGIIKVWEAKTGIQVLTLRGHNSVITCANYRPDGKEIVMGYKHKVKILDTKTGLFLHDCIGHTSGISSTQYSPDGNYFVTASNDKTAKIWDAKTGKLLHNLTGHSHRIRSASYSADGKRIVTASSDKTAKIWDANTGKLLVTLEGHTSQLESAHFSPDGNFIVTASGDKMAKVWDGNNGNLLQNLDRNTAWVQTALYSPDGNQIVTTEGYGDTVKVWDAKTGKRLHDLIGHTGWISSVQFSPDGNLIITSSGDNTAKVWDVKTGRLLHNLEGHTGNLSSAQFSPKGNHIVTSSDDKSVRIWDTETGKLLHNLLTETNVSEAQYNLNGDLLMLRHSDGALSFWTSDKGERMLTIYPIDTSDWVAIHPSGLFDASPNAMKLMYYVVGLEVIELDQLKERYYEPGLFERVMTRDGRGLRDVKNIESLQMYPEAWVAIDIDTLHIHLTERNGGIGKVNLFVNNKEVVSDINPGRDTSLLIDLKIHKKFYRSDTLNYIGIRSWNAEGWLKSREITLEYKTGFIHSKGQERILPLTEKVNYDPNYYAIVVGTSHFRDAQLDLKYADKDSKDMASALTQTANVLFGADKVQVKWFSTDTQSGSTLASKENIKAAFDTLANNSRPEDVVVVYFSGHGVMHKEIDSEQFYYLTKDVASGILTDPAIRNNYAISSDELTRWLTNIPAQKQVLILDACASGSVIDNLLTVRNTPASQIRALDRLKDRTGMFVLAGCAADKVSYEASQFGQGLLTYSLLLGMSGSALREGSFVDVSQLFQFARDKVPVFARDIGGIQTPTLASPYSAESFDIGSVTKAVKIPLETEKPVFIRSAFQEEERFNDVLQLSKALDEYLVDFSAETATRGFIFVDANQYPNAYSVKGRYTLENGRLILNGRLFRGDEMKGNFEAAGTQSQLQELVEQIYVEVDKIIQQR